MYHIFSLKTRNEKKENKRLKPNLIIFISFIITKIWFLLKYGKKTNRTYSFIKWNVLKNYDIKNINNKGARLRLKNTKYLCTKLYSWHFLKTTYFLSSILLRAFSLKMQFPKEGKFIKNKQVMHTYKVKKIFYFS